MTARQPDRKKILRTFSTWLTMPTYSEECRFLEAHLELLEPGTITLLEELLCTSQDPTKWNTSSIAIKIDGQKLESYLNTLSEIYKGGKSVEATRKTYIDLHGGLTVGTPSWLAQNIAQLDELQRSNQPDETTLQRLILLRSIMKRAHDDPYVTTESYAELLNMQADILEEEAFVDNTEACEAAIVSREAALEVYTIAQYPRQYAKTQVHLADHYHTCIIGDQSKNYEQAIACYKAALHIYILDNFPEEYASTQAHLGLAYRKRFAGERRANLEYTIVCLKEALQVYTPEAFPEERAIIQNNLGLAYQERIESERRINIEKAIECYQAALEILTRDFSPLLRATTQYNLGNAYQERIEGMRHSNLEQAIICYEAALQVRTRSASARDYAGTQNNLGLAYKDRIEGDKRANLERAIACFRVALEVYTFDAFPINYARAQYNLGLTYYDRLEGERHDNLEQAIACYEAALQVRTLEAVPNDYANTQYNLGLAYHERLAGKRHSNLKQAIHGFEAALKVYTRVNFPEEYAKAQVALGDISQRRIDGERRINFERAIACYNVALEVYTHDSFPEEYANTHNSLGVAYQNRLLGPKGYNLEQAIRYYHAALEIYTTEKFPEYYARTHLNLGSAYGERIEGERSINLEQAISHFNAALQFYIRDEYAREWALIQHNLGAVYDERIAGDRAANLEQAIAHYTAALQFQREGTLEYAHCLSNIGNVYRNRIVGEQQANLKKAVACYRGALDICTRDAFPTDYHMIQLNLAGAEAERWNWADVDEAYRCAQDVENLLVRLGAGTAGQDTILREGNGTGARRGFALTRLGREQDAVVAIEEGRTRSIAEALALDVIDLTQIKDEKQRTRYEMALEAFRKAQKLTNTSLDRQFINAPYTVTEHELRSVILEQADLYRIAQQAFEEVVAEIQSGQDLADPSQVTIDAEAIIEAAECCGTRHAIVYLLTTPWGGIAIAAFSTHPEKNMPSHFDMLDLPGLTDIFVVNLIESDLGDDENTVIGGFNCAQSGNGFKQIVDVWEGETFYEQAMTLHKVCMAEGVTSTLDRAAQEILKDGSLTSMINKSSERLSPKEKRAIARSLRKLFLEYELERCLNTLGEAAMCPLATWLCEKEVLSVTIIPCGWLAAFPLCAIPITSRKTFGDLFITSVAPSVRVLSRKKRAVTQRRGLYTFGDAETRTKPLPWGEAESLTLFRLAQDQKLYAQVKVQRWVTRDSVKTALQRGQIVGISCHGSFNLAEPLQSALTLARGEQLTLGDVLSHDVDLRGLRLLILSACQTAMLDIRGARDEVRSLAVGMLQAGAEAVLASLWPIDDRATYLLITRFAQEWLPRMDTESPAAALVRAQHWLRTVTNRELQVWHTVSTVRAGEPESRKARSIVSKSLLAPKKERKKTGLLIRTSERGDRYEADRAASLVHEIANQATFPDACPYESPIYWAGFQVAGW